MKRETRERWERANALIDCVTVGGWERCPLKGKEDEMGELYHAEHASLALDGLDISELP